MVSDASFTIEAGEVVGLLGPNGAGKTTCFYMVVGMVLPDSGDILLDSESISHLPMFQRARIGLSYLPQEASIFRRLTVRENILVALEAQGYEASNKQDRLDQLLRDFDVYEKQNLLGMSLSGGERRRVEIARAIACKPKFLLLDEPFAGIDPIAIQDIQQIIKKLKDMGIGVLITDHNVRETLGICDHAYILKDGFIQVSGNAESIANSEVAKKFYLGENFRL